MEYCDAGSVLDIMKLRGLHHGLPRGQVLALSEEQIATVLLDTLKGLQYLHMRKKIHRQGGENWTNRQCPHNYHIGVVMNSMLV
jgi:serine/threonine protein kinase